MQAAFLSIDGCWFTLVVDYDFRARLEISLVSSGAPTQIFERASLTCTCLRKFVSTVIVCFCFINGLVFPLSTCCEILLIVKTDR